MSDKPAPTRATVFTVGHSNLELPDFLALIARHGIEAIGDVRSMPFSRYTPQFNRDVLETALKKANVRYVPLGKELGARRDEPECYIENKARYDRIARAPLFLEGLDRVRSGAAKYRIALMCSEKDPLTCHRTILVSRHLRSDLDVRHILEDGALESADEAEDRLLKLLDLPAGDLFSDREEFVKQAYEKQGDRIAFVRSAEETHAGSVEAAE